MPRKLMVSLVLVLQAGMAHAGQATTNSAEKGLVHADVLLKTRSAWDGSLYDAYPAGPPELTLVKITIAPNTELPWHTHAAPNAAYVLSGEITVEKRRDGAQKLLTKGDVLAELVGEPHRGVTGSSPVELLVFYAGAEGVPLSEPEQ
ncbi:Cupin domain protein [compost metagenome]